MNDLIKGLDLYEIDSLDIVYKLITGDNSTMRLIGDKDHVFKFHVPEEFRESPPIVRIHTISEVPKTYADNQQMSWDCIVQIDVWDSSYPREIALKINKLMKTIYFQQETPTFEYDPDTYLFRDCRRYRGIIEADL